MDVSSVSSSSYSPATQTQAKVQSQPTEPPKKAEPKPPAQETQAASNEQRKPPPVVNTQGQTTGRIVNTSA